MKAKDRIGTFLRDNNRADYCGECLARSLHLSVGSAYEAVRKLEGTNDFRRVFGECSACKRPRSVICAV